MRAVPLFTLMLLGAVVSQGAVAAGLLQPPSATPGRLIVKLRANANVQVANGVTGISAYSADPRFSGTLQRLGISRLKPLFPGLALRANGVSAVSRAAWQGLDRIHVIDVPAQDRGQSLRALKNDPAVEYVEPDQVARVSELNDTYLSSSGSWGQSYGDLWGLGSSGATSAWTRSTGSGIVVAVVDTGIDVAHEDLAANIAVNSGEIAGNGLDDDNNGYIDDYYGWNFVDGNNNVADGYGHGSHVAGTIAAVANNGKGIAGLAYSARVMAVKILGNDGSGSMSAAAQGLVYAADRGARVLNNSWGGPVTRVVDDAIRYAHGKGAVVVTAAGNDYGSNADMTSPAGAPYALVVSAADASDLLADFSNIGMKLDVAAPGVDVLSALAPSSYFADSMPGLIVGDKYLHISGTSMATPHVAGAAALLLSMQPTLTAEQVRYWLRNGAQDLGTTGFDKHFGYGKLRADTALDLAAAGAAPAVSGAFTSLYRGMFATGQVTIKGEANGPGFSSYELAYTRLGSSNTYTTFKTSQQAVTGEAETLGVLDASSLPGGEYALRLRVKAANNTYLDYYDHLYADASMKAGWPRVLSTESFSGNGSWEFEATLVDLDNDGIKEIVVPTMNAIHAMNADGSTRAGFPFYPGSGCDISGSVTAGDLNGDGKPELVFPCWAYPMSRGTINAIDALGRQVAGFPAGAVNTTAFGATGAAARGHVAMSDLNGDGRPEIISSGIMNNNDMSRGQVFAVVVNGQGQTQAGWPQLLPTFSFNSDIALTNGRNMLADVDRDGIDEIVINDLTSGGSGARLAVYRANGTLLRSIDLSAQLKLAFDPLFADMNGDGTQEFVTVGCKSTGQLMATVVSATGTTLSGWPRAVSSTGRNCDATTAPYTVVDLNQDNKLELVVGTDGSLKALNYLGTALAGFPKAMGRDFRGANIAVAQFGAATPALIFQVDNQLWAVDRTGTALPGWPKGMPISGQAAPAIGTLENSSKLAIVVNAPVELGNYDSQIMVFEENLAAGTLASSCPSYRCSAGRTGSVTPRVVSFNKVYNQVYVRGTNNNWATTTPMALVGHNTWEATTSFGSTSSERFKLDINGDWAINFGDTNRDLIADAAGSDILISQGAGSYKIRFNDSTKVYSVTKQVAANLPPVANAGPNQTITSSTPVSVILNGSASSDPDGSIVSYAWAEFINTAWQSLGSGVSLTLPSVAPGTHTYRLTVTDNKGATASTEMLVNIVAGGFNKVYNQVYVRGTNNGWTTSALMSLVANNTWEVTTTFGATTSERFKFDVNGDWAVNFGDTNRDLIADAAGSDILVSQGAGSYKIRFNDSTRVYSVAKLTGVNVTPVANAGPDQSITSATAVAVTLNGSASSDSDGSIASYVWDENVGGNWQTVGNSAVLTLSAVSVAQHRYRLTVTDNQGASSSDEVLVTITAGGFNKVYNQVYLRGTNNNWGTTTTMTLVANNTWEVITAFGATTGERFKFDINANWTLNFGDNNADGVAEQSGGDILVSQGAGNYRIRFNDSSKVYTVVKQ